ncbi:ATP-dependent Zn protease [Microcystis aeruginosa]|uniref:ATP-dependent Zn protease n=1 Tax=Microcystis aeruginosa Ma_QC_C_20070703_M131 TaxID=2486263 RepID=A0A551X0R6_MICAE|nr:ATP-dependent Zn protease [Microcystis aeruginosa]MDB9393217.1 ATP-dependent Zn protease [Microcystis aeruginosa CS-579]TRT42314.1 MAG: ATP-dependent Zn protease [Microcystis aeruginosa Ma_QC_C_20070703_M131]
MEQTALNLIAITVFSITLSVFVTPLLSISPFVPALATFSLLGLVTVDTLTFNNRGVTLLLDALSPSKHRQRVIYHEAGHFLTAYILGIPIASYSLTAWEAFRQGQEGVGGVQFELADLEQKVKNFTDFPAFLERISTVWMAGIAAETLVYGKAEGGESDRFYLQSALKLAGVPENNYAQKERWSLLQAKTLLEKQQTAYQALVIAMEKRTSVEECCRVISESLV